LIKSKITEISKTETTPPFLTRNSGGEITGRNFNFFLKKKKLVSEMTIFISSLFKALFLKSF